MGEHVVMLVPDWLYAEKHMSGKWREQPAELEGTKMSVCNLYVIGSTPKAWKVRQPGRGEFWLPKSITVFEPKLKCLIEYYKMLQDAGFDVSEQVAKMNEW